MQSPCRTSFPTSTNSLKEYIRPVECSLVEYRLALSWLTCTFRRLFKLTCHFSQVLILLVNVNRTLLINRLYASTVAVSPSSSCLLCSSDHAWHCRCKPANLSSAFRIGLDKSHVDNVNNACDNSDKDWEYDRRVFEAADRELCRVLSCASRLSRDDFRWSKKSSVSVNRGPAMLASHPDWLDESGLRCLICRSRVVAWVAWWQVNELDWTDLKAEGITFQEQLQVWIADQHGMVRSLL